MWSDTTRHYHVVVTLLVLQIKDDVIWPLAEPKTRSQNMNAHTKSKSIDISTDPTGHQLMKENVDTVINLKMSFIFY